MQLSFVTLDVFTSTPFRGNPVAIIDVPAGTQLSQDQKQLVAREFNLSESVFRHEQTEEDRQSGNVRIDIFTTIAEVPFAGHPTVGTANYLLRYLKNDAAKALVTKAGRIPISLAAGGDPGIELAVAHNVHIHNQPFAKEDFGHYPVVSIVKGMTFILAKLPDLEALAKPTRNLLGTENTYQVSHKLDEGWQAGLVTSFFYVDLGRDESGTRLLRTRMLGSREDPATGSASSALCSYLSLSEKGGQRKRKYQLTQGVEMGRKSDISIEVTLSETGDAIEKVMLKGEALKVMEGVIEV